MKTETIKAEATENTIDKLVFVDLKKQFVLPKSLTIPADWNSWKVTLYIVCKLLKLKEEDLK